MGLVMTFVLTRDMSASSELGGHLGVHGDHDLLLLRHQGIPIFNLFLYPLSEVRTDHGGAYIDDPLLGDLLQVRLIG